MSRLDQLKDEFARDLAAAATTKALGELHTRYFGSKGRVKELFRELKTLSAEEKKQLGAELNPFAAAAQEQLNEKLARVSAEEERGREARELLDVTLPARPPRLGHLHPITIVRREIEAIFREMSYTIDPGPEIDTDWYNFGALNFTPDHPARDTQDTFFLDAGELLLRTHTSNAQIHSMERWKPPVKVLSAGRVYRRDEITMRRSPMFHQAEGFLVDRGIHIGHLRATLEHVVHRLFGAESKMRMRPSFFPITEPSAEVDISCVFCKGAGCGTCSQTGWMEILGCGMIHPQVLRNVGIDPEEWSGFAFGMGIDRVAMLKFDIPNIRTLFENDLRVLQQF
jgi:phenylalanyl-tRNA synthetase alpha chain